MDRRDTLLVLLTLGVLSLAARAQPTAKPARIGFLFAGTLAQRPQAQGFWQGLQELGYTPGKNVVIEVREAEGKTERLPELARNLSTGSRTFWWL
jgi:hypothetical protein